MGGKVVLDGIITLDSRGMSEWRVFNIIIVSLRSALEQLPLMNNKMEPRSSLSLTPPAGGMRLSHTSRRPLPSPPHSHCSLAFQSYWTGTRAVASPSLQPFWRRGRVAVASFSQRRRRRLEDDTHNTASPPRYRTHQTQFSP